jgi:hypothetical protein
VCTVVLYQAPYALTATGRRRTLFLGGLARVKLVVHESTASDATRSGPARGPADAFASLATIRIDGDGTSSRLNGVIAEHGYLSRHAGLRLGIVGPKDAEDVEHVEDVK